jgi:chromosome segregation ATPase
MDRMIVRLQDRLEHILETFCCEIKNIHGTLHELHQRADECTRTHANSHSELYREIDSRRSADCEYGRVLFELERRITGIEQVIDGCSTPVEYPSDSGPSMTDSFIIREDRSDNSIHALASINESFTDMLAETKAAYQGQIQMLRRTVTALTEEVCTQRDHYSSILAERDAELQAFRAVAASQSAELECYIEKCKGERLELRDLVDIMEETLRPRSAGSVLCKGG